MGRKIYTHEKLNIIMQTSVSRGAADRIKNYLDIFSGMKRLSDLHITRMELTADDRVFSLTDYVCEKSENETYLDENGTERLQVFRYFWKDNAELSSFLSAMSSSGKISMEMDFSVYAGYGTDVGYDFWHGYLEDTDEIKDGIDYSCVEYHEKEKKAFCYRFENNVAGFQEFSPERPEKCRTENWFCGNFSVNVFTYWGDFEEEFTGTLKQMFEEMAGKYGFENRRIPEDPDAFIYDTAVVLPASAVNDFVADLQAAADFVTQNEYEFEICNTFTDAKHAEMSCMKIENFEGNIIAGYCSL